MQLGWHETSRRHLSGRNNLGANQLLVNRHIKGTTHEDLVQRWLVHVEPIKIGCQEGSTEKIVPRLDLFHDGVGHRR